MNIETLFFLGVGGVQGLVLHHLPGALATALTPAAPKTSVYSPKSRQVSESSERGQPEVTGSPGLTPGEFGCTGNGSFYRAATSSQP